MASETDIANLALGKIGGAGDAVGSNAFITSINDSDKVSSWMKLAFPRARRTSIKDLATGNAPFRSTLRFKNLDAQLSSTPEIGNWTYAFNLPGDCLAVVSQFSEDSIAARSQKANYTADSAPVTYQFETIANSDGTGLILLTDFLTNTDQDGAFISYVIDTPNTAGMSEELIDCIATKLAQGVCPVIGRDIETSDNMLVKYRQVAIPNAKRANLFDFDFESRSIPNTRGGRSAVLSSLSV